MVYCMLCVIVVVVGLSISIPLRATCGLVGPYISRSTLSPSLPPSLLTYISDNPCFPVIHSHPPPPSLFLGVSCL
ncbi:hypothetical protein P691DRAFT_430504 [Macrolepiota fuliginosa MF-IS2]|uniref:Uncharacterized protein n=1 Tax=Macrolepiota fuliginosa MF-IS2 TaxID=1400762 RepID=A0A9P5X2K1_9AGAR|nr:hypothetical protein P691DRAFT_430504 [Macrolepiota fuliginosa MF-IS2]